MTAPPAPTETPDLTRIRTHRDRTGAVRVYSPDSILLGTLARERVTGARGRKCWRWGARPAACAWTLHSITAPWPPADQTAPLPPVHVSRDTAARALVDHLRAAGAAGVLSLYGATP